MTPTIDTTIEVAVRRARMDAARGCSPIVAAMAAEAGSQLVAQQQLAREALAARLAKRGSGGRPSPTPIPIPVPAVAPAGAASPQETSDA